MLITSSLILDRIKFVCFYTKQKKNLNIVKAKRNKIDKFYLSLFVDNTFTIF